MCGEMSEWFMVYAWKAYVGVTLPGVRIPLSPPLKYGSGPAHWELAELRQDRKVATAGEYF